MWCSGCRGLHLVFLVFGSHQRADLELPRGRGARVEPVERSVTARHLADLVHALEGGRVGAWRLNEISHRFPSMLDRLLGFRIAITDLHGKFKMHQDERIEEVRDAMAGALRTGRSDLAELIGRFNQARLRKEGES